MPAFIPAYIHFERVSWLVEFGYENQGKRCNISALGRADLDAVYVEHPIQDQTPQEIALKAEMAIESIVDALTRNVP